MSDRPLSPLRTPWSTWLLLLILCCCANATAPPTPTPAPSSTFNASSVTPASVASGDTGETTSFVILSVACGVAAAVGLGLLTACLVRRQHKNSKAKPSSKGLEGSETVAGGGAGAGGGHHRHHCHRRCRNNYHHHRCRQAAVVTPEKEPTSSDVVAPMFADSAAWEAAEEGEADRDGDGGGRGKRTNNPLYAVPVRPSAATAAATNPAATACSPRQGIEAGKEQAPPPAKTASTTASGADSNAASRANKDSEEGGGGGGWGTCRDESGSGGGGGSGRGGGTWSWPFRGATLTTATDDSSDSSGADDNNDVAIGKVSTGGGDLPIGEQDAVNRDGSDTRVYTDARVAGTRGHASGGCASDRAPGGVATRSSPFSTEKSVRTHKPPPEVSSFSGSTIAGSDCGSNASRGRGGDGGGGNGGGGVSGGGGNGGGGGSDCDGGKSGGGSGGSGGGGGGYRVGGGCAFPSPQAVEKGGTGKGKGKGKVYPRPADPRKRPEWEQIKDAARRKSENRGRQGSSVLRDAEGVVAGAESLALDAFVPGEREVATLVAGLARLAAADHRGDEKDMRRRLQWCRSVVLTLENARALLRKATEGDDPDDDEAKRVLLEDVRQSVGDMVEIVLSYKNKHIVKEVFFSTLFRRRQGEADEAIKSAEKHLELLATEDAPGHQRKNAQDILAKANKKRRQRPQRQQDQVDIPAADVEVMRGEILGMGGFGAVYLADYKGLNVAAKLVVFRAALTLTPASATATAFQGKGFEGGASAIHGIDPASEVDGFPGIHAVPLVNTIPGVNDTPGVNVFAGGSDEVGVAVVTAPPCDRELDQKARRRAAVSLARKAAACARAEARQRLAIVRELEAMKRLRGPHTVHTYGAVISVKDELVLVMEFLSGGDLLLRLSKARRPLDEGTLRGIVRDVCAGMAFLHGEAFVHGDLKSANVLFDANGRAKIADLGTPLWTQNTNRVPIYSARPGGLMSLPWAAPEILRRERASFKSDVYSFGVVVWECLTRKVPWAKVTSVDTLSRAVQGGRRPALPVDAPTDLASMTSACWDSDPAARPTFELVLVGLNASVHEHGKGSGVRSSVGSGAGSSGGSSVSTRVGSRVGGGGGGAGTGGSGVSTVVAS